MINKLLLQNLFKKKLTFTFILIGFLIIPKTLHAIENTLPYFTKRLWFNNTYLSKDIFLAKNISPAKDSIITNESLTSSDLSDTESLLNLDLEEEDTQIIEIRDPLEIINRKSYNFTIWIDHKIIRHVDSCYIYIIPEPIRISVVNMSKNINEPINAVNHLLQFKFISFIKTVMRFAINSTLGFFGSVDIASNLNLLSNPNDFGYTLTYYHIGEGFFIFVPLLGPYTFKNGMVQLASSLTYSTVLDKVTKLNYLTSFVVQGASNTLYYLENRDSLISIIEDSPDGYSLLKSAYIQNRQYTFKKLKQTW